ncbi:hypothetical protein H1X88_21700 [Vibrio parahaemolyticus]|uniref:hypothetical protein n=1 Tax=Vibrio parahaemolyticus TaxID=670 RepID=UPI00165631C3|nr:hypothetical protein [Vibrio parahaemolyticus]MBC8659372.1 hypothetical protein [Vibrio parahaemolyticus]
MGWIDRRTTTYSLENLPFDLGGKLTLIAPHLVRVYIPGYKFPVDIGSWCYSERRRKSTDYTDTNSTLNLVVQKSFRASRKAFISQYLHYLYQHLQLGRSAGTLKTSVGQFQRFVNWCDDNYVEGLDSKRNYVKAVGLFTEYLIDLIRKSLISINTAATLQLVLYTTGRYIYSDPYGDLFRDIRKISRSTKAVKVTQTPEEHQVKSALKMYSLVFHQLADFTLNFEKFPKRLDFEHGYFWFFPTQMPFAGPSNVDVKTKHGKSYRAYDYINGKVNSLEDIKQKVKIESSAIIARKSALNKINYSNKNKYDIHRMKAASMAFQAFMMLFSATTGMSLGQMASLEWGGDYHVDHDRQGFKSIKYRAHGKHVEFYIESKFVAVFKKALKLRDYLLSGVELKSFKYLFFSFNGKIVYPVGMNLSTDFHRRLEICFDYKNKVTTRMWRAHKSNWLLQNSDLPTTAMLLQNTPETVIKHYSEGSDIEASKELSNFFLTFKKSIVIDNKNKSTPISTGQCLDVFSPKADSIHVVEPDCKTPEGCLFCIHFRVHADAEDYKKLLSLRYILSQSRHLASNSSHYINTITPLIKRIDSIVEQIDLSGHLPQKTLEFIRQSIDEEEQLSDYWAHKLQMMDDLEMI